VIYIVGGNIKAAVYIIILCFISVQGLFADFLKKDPAVSFIPGEYVIEFKDDALLKKNNKVREFFKGKIKNICAYENILVLKDFADASKDEDGSFDKVEQKLKKIFPEIISVEPNYIYTLDEMPDDPEFKMQWGLKNEGSRVGRYLYTEGVDIHILRAWDIVKGSKDIIVAIIDTGIDHNHKDLSKNMWVNEAEQSGTPGVDDDLNGYIDDIHGYDFINDDPFPMDNISHGTHVSGIIGAVGNNGEGISGINHKISLMALKVFDNIHAGGAGTLDALVAAVYYAIRNGARVINCSWSGPESKILKDVFEKAMEKDVIVIAAAGNRGSDIDIAPVYPAGYDLDNIITVTAVDFNGELPYFSSWGKTSVDVAAPGVRILSTIPDNKYEYYFGTSMAVPHVTGISALIIANFPSIKYSEIKRRIVGRTTPLKSLKGKVLSGGLVNAYHSLIDTLPINPLDDPSTWNSKHYKLSTEHPLLDTGKSWHVKRYGVKKLSVFFEKFELSNLNNRVLFMDKNRNVYATWTGIQNRRFSPPVDGDTLIIKLETIYDWWEVNKYGFDVTEIAWE